MPARKPPPPDEKPQFDRFIKTAREIGADETDEALENAIKKITRPPSPNAKAFCHSGKPSRAKKV